MNALGSPKYPFLEPLALNSAPRLPRLYIRRPSGPFSTVTSSSEDQGHGCQGSVCLAISITSILHSCGKSGLIIPGVGSSRGLGYFFQPSALGPLLFHLLPRVGLNFCHRQSPKPVSESGWIIEAPSWRTFPQSTDLWEGGPSSAFP